jgi:hypothetical protein
MEGGSSLSTIESYSFLSGSSAFSAMETYGIRTSQFLVGKLAGRL